MLFHSNWRTKLSQPLRKPDFSKQLEDRHHFIIEISGWRTDKVAAVIEANQGQIHRELKLMPSFAVELPYFSLEELAHLQYVKKIWHDAPVAIRLDTAVPAVGGLKIQELGFTGQGVVVAVLDTGIHPHPDLIIPQNRIASWCDLVNQKDNPYDDHGHGTHVAGIIAGSGRSSRGRYKGIAPEATLVGIKVLDDEGQGSISGVLAGIEWCLDHLANLKIKVINLSFGTTAQESYHFDPLCRATTIAWQKGITVCTAAGNQGPGQRIIDVPGINPRVITVGNVDDRRTLTGNDKASGRGLAIANVIKPDILAPGTEITSLKIAGGYQTLTGTSMSTSLVSGAIALMLQKWPKLTPDQIKYLLVKNARPLGQGANQEGAGVLGLDQIFKDRTQPTILTLMTNYWDPITQIIGNQVIKGILGKTGQDHDLNFIKQKNGEIIQNTLLNILADYFKARPLFK